KRRNTSLSSLLSPLPPPPPPPPPPQSVLSQGSCRVLKKLKSARQPLEVRVNKKRRQKDIDPIHEEESHEENVEPTTIGRLPLIIVGSNNPVDDQRSFVTKTQVAGLSLSDANDRDAGKDGSSTARKQRRTLGPKRASTGQQNIGFPDVSRRLTEMHRDPTFVQIDTLVERGVFGLLDLLVPDQPRVALVSNGAECIVINKRFYEEHTPPKLMAILRSKVQPYPSDNDLQVSLQTHVDWQQRKKRALQSAMKRGRARHVNVHDSRDTGVPQWTDRRVSRC
ncbi:hypothetical protein LSAT2_004166, partial [Lamellibrachia satsuma]